jgi:hypothetical protein
MDVRAEGRAQSSVLGVEIEEGGHGFRVPGSFLD